MEAQICTALSASLDPAGAVAAVTALKGLEASPDFSTALLRVTAAAAVEAPVRQAAATYFKNLVKRAWTEDTGSQAFPEATRSLIRANLLQLTCSVPRLIQRQLSEALSQISRSDFPERWPTLIDELVAQLQGATTRGDAAGAGGVLETAVAVFERFRNAPDTDETRAPLRLALDAFAGPLTASFRAVSARLAAACAQPATALAAVTPELRALASMCACFTLLSWVDLPDVFEDALPEWMGNFHTYLALAEARLQSPPEESEEGPLEALQAGVLECVALYADKYDEEFEPFQPQLAQDVCGLLLGMAPARLTAPCTDNLVTRAMRLLASIVAKPAMTAALSEEGLLRAVLSRIVVPNMALRESDLECLEDNPADFIAGDIEGSDSETRRRYAGELVRACVRAAPARAIPLVLETVAASLAAYAADRAGAEGAKDTAVALLMALAVKAHTAQSGVTALTEGVSLGDFLSAHVLSELCEADVNARPLAKAACIKFVASFRSIFTRDQLHQLLPILARLLAAEPYVVHTYAAAAFERILTVKDRGMRPEAGSSSSGGGGGGGVPFVELRVSLDAVAPLATPVLAALFGRMTRPGYAENEYLMRCVMRCVTVAKGHCVGAVGSIAGGLASILARVVRNPANPAFNHFMFESLGCLMRSSCAAQPALLAQFEGLLFPAAQTVMAGEVLEFLPYVFQLLALALHLSPAPAPPPQPAAPAQPSYSPAFKGLLPHLLQRRPWERKSSVPALAELLRVYLEKGAAGELLGGGGGGLGTVVGIAGMLLGSRGHETLAFALLDSLLTHVPLEALAPQLPSIFNGLQACVMASKALRIAKCFIHTAALLCGLRGPPALVAALSAGQLPALVESVLAPYAARLEGRVARSEAAIGLTRLLCECPELLAGGRDPGAWCKLLGAVVELVGAGGAAGAAGAPAASRAALLGGSAALMEDEELPEDVDAGAPPPEYTASYNRLLHCALPSASAFASAGLPAPAVYLSQSLQRLAASNPAVQGIIAASPVAAQVASLPRA